MLFVFAGFSCFKIWSPHCFIIYLLNLNSCEVFYISKISLLKQNVL